MSSEVAFLEIRVGAQGVTEARNRLKEMTEASEKAEKAAKKLADETEKAEARKGAIMSAAAAKADRIATTAAINDAKMRQSIVDAAAAAEAKKIAAAEKAAKQADKVATDRAIKEGIAAQKMADDVAKAEARKATIAQAAARKLESAVTANGQRQLAEVKKWLMTEEEALRESYLRRRRIIETQASGTQKQMLLAAQDYKYGQDLLTLRGTRLDSSRYGKTSSANASYVGSEAVMALSTGQGIQGLTSTLVRFAPAAAAAAASYALVNKALGESDAQKTALLQLRAATGSVENATAAYEALDEMEDRIPLDAEEMSKAFVRLVQTGLNPSERSITALGNIAAGTGDSLENVTEKVANATMGNFKGLRDLGIHAEEDGNKVKMTFRGVTTSVSNDSKSIQAYLTNLGETTFAGSLDKKMEGLGGSVHKLKNTWNDMFRDIGKSNVGPLIKDMADTALAALTELRDMVGGSWIANLGAGFATGIRSFLIEARTAAEIAMATLKGDAKRIDAALKLNDERHKALIIEEESAQNEKDFLDALKQQNLEIDKQGQIVAKRKDILATFEDSGKNKVRDKTAESQAKKDKAEFDELVKKMDDEEAVIEQSFQRRQKLIDRYTKAGSDQWTRMSAANVDKYAEEMENTTAGKLKEQHRKEVVEVQESLRDQEQALRESYEKQRQIILDNVAEEGKRDAILEALADKEIERRKKLDAEKIKKTEESFKQKEDLFAPYLKEEEQIRLSEKRKLAEYKKAREEELINDIEYQQLKVRLHRQTEEKLADIDMKTKEDIAGNSAALFGNLARATKNMGGEQSATYKGLFAMSKAFSIAQATMSIATGTAKALELGWPAGLAAGLAVAAQGAGLLATITSSNYSGAYDKGGYIPAGRVGLVGERGPEFVQGPAMVTGRQQSAAIMQGGQGFGGGQPLNLRVVVAQSPAEVAKFLTTSDGEVVLNAWAKRNATTIRRLVA